jgi:hypothetical protein
MTSAAKFWIETPLTNVEALIADYNGCADRADQDLKSVYLDDSADFQAALEIFRKSDAETLAQHITDLDTFPRDNIVVAFQKDCGDEFIENILGFSLR